MCLLHFTTEILKRKYRGRFPLLHIVLESGHSNYGDAERIFFEEKKTLEEMGLDVLRTITKADKDQSGELMMADFVAHTTYQMQNRSLATGLPMPMSDPISKGYKSIAHFEIHRRGIGKHKGERHHKGAGPKG